MVNERKVILVLGVIIIMACLLDLLGSLSADNRNASRERSLLELCPDVMARDYCYRPVHMMTTGCTPRVPTAELPYCPKP